MGRQSYIYLSEVTMQRKFEDCCGTGYKCPQLLGGRRQVIVETRFGVICCGSVWSCHWEDQCGQPIVETRFGVRLKSNKLSVCIFLVIFVLPCVRLAPFGSFASCIKHLKPSPEAVGTAHKKPRTSSSLVLIRW